MAELDGHVYNRFQLLCAEGDSFADEGEYPDALKKYWSAWDRSRKRIGPQRNGC
jgi:hypothetical protein